MEISLVIREVFSYLVLNIQRVRIIECLLGMVWDHCIDLFGCQEILLPFLGVGIILEGGVASIWYQSGLGFFRLSFNKSKLNLILLICCLFWWFGLADLLIDYHTLDFLFFGIMTTCNAKSLGVKFTSKNYSSWKCKFHLFVTGEELKGHIDRIDPTPTEDSNYRAIYIIILYIYTFPICP